MTLIDFNKKELRDIYSSLQYTRLEIGFENESEAELYDRLTKLMDKVAKLRQVCDCKENVSE
jgi:thymidine kinase